MEPVQSQSGTANGTAGNGTADNGTANGTADNGTAEATADRAADETFNPWTVVHLVFDHLAAEGLHPTLGEGGDPGAPAAELLQRLGILPAPEGNRYVADKVQDRLAELRSAVFPES